MEELEIGDYINDINSYHLHMFDKHDVTTKKLDVIVEKAGKVDANYAAQIEGYCSLLGEYGKKFETVCAMLALDLIGVKVFRYSDETAEAVASGEKLLKESGTIYESFADMMSPDDAAKYLDFLENGSKEGLTSAELADALLVSQKVGYEDVWDLRNPCDVLESGKYSILSYEDAENIAFDAIHGPNNADAVVLGKYGDGGPTAYTSVAKDMDAQYFQLDNWDELAARYSDDEIWKINEKFLDIQTSSGREIYLSHNPEEYLGKEQFYSRELQYLLDNGYKFVDEGGIWHAVR